MTLTDLAVGSIGNIHIDYDSQNNRVKGWVQSQDQIYVLEDSTGWMSVNSNVQNARTSSSLNHATRETLRFVTNNYDATEIFQIEAVAEFRSPRFQGFSINYIARNQQSRLTRDEFYREQIQSLQEIQNMERNQRSLPENYTIERLNSNTDGILNLMRESFTRNGDIVTWYEPSEENLQAMLENSVTYIVRDENNNIVSMAMAERADINIQNQSATIYEIANCATSRNHRNQGLLQNCIQAILNDQELQEADLIYTEARIAHRPIIKAFHNLGFEYGGVLRNHARVGGDRELPEDQNTENLAVMYMR